MRDKYKVFHLINVTNPRYYIGKVSGMGEEFPSKLRGIGIGEVRWVVKPCDRNDDKDGEQIQGYERII